ncbi:MAG: HAMP domain-containing histidine kinase [Clostridia bacterium]|nr:HAMP domain-containing histidine kinase [Clostridia bacterium]
MNEKAFSKFFLDYIKDTADAVIATDANMRIIYVSGAAKHILPGLDAGYDITDIIKDADISGGRVLFYEYDAEVCTLGKGKDALYIFRFPKSTYAVSYAYPPLETRYAEMIESLVSSLYNPLTVIFSAAELFAKKNGTRQSQKELDIVWQNGYRLLKIAQNIEAFGSAGQKKSEDKHNIINIDAVDFINKTASSISSALKMKKISIHVESTKNRIFVQADEYRFERIVLLLISNAVKRLKNGGVIKISAFETPSHAAVCVADTGALANASEIEKMFAGGDIISYDTFDAAAAKLYTEQLSGTIVVSSKEGEGLKVTFSLPKGSAVDALFKKKLEITKKGRFEQKYIDLSDIFLYTDL